MNTHTVNTHRLVLKLELLAAGSKALEEVTHGDGTQYYQVTHNGKEVLETPFYYEAHQHFNQIESPQRYMLLSPYAEWPSFITAVGKPMKEPQSLYNSLVSTPLLTERLYQISKAANALLDKMLISVTAQITPQLP